MKRSPLNRRTPLKRGISQLKRTPLKKRSTKTQKLYTEKRIPLVIQILEERPICEICWTQASVDVHEKLTRGRSGGVHGLGWLDPDNCLSLCRECHRRITDDPKWAQANGFILPSGATEEDRRRADRLRYNYTHVPEEDPNPATRREGADREAHEMGE